MLSVTYKPCMLSVIMLNVVMLSVVVYTIINLLLENKMYFYFLTGLLSYNVIIPHKKIKRQAAKAAYRP
jgi:hypothetical protein